VQTFNEMLLALQALEDELIELSNEDLQRLLGDIKDKVDAVHLWESKLKAEAERVGNEIKQLQIRKRTIDNSLKRFREYLAYSLEENNTPELIGKSWTIKLRQRKSVSVKDEPTSDDYIKLLDINQKLVERSYKWNANELKSAFKTDPETFGEYVNESTSKFIQFLPKKEK
jgi:hypothetical protein